MQGFRKKFFRGLALFSIYALGILGIVATGGGGGGDDDGETYNYTITSATWFTGGQQVAVVRFGISGSCLAPSGVTSPITRVGAGTVKTPGKVSFSFKTKIFPPMFESVYIDNNASGNLDNGDRVWGDDPNDLFGVCFDAFGTDQLFDWETVAVQIQTASGLSQPSILYTGASMAFRGESVAEQLLMMKNAVIVDGDGYDSMFTVPIDINPTSDFNAIEPGSKEVIPVAVLGSIDFDATQIDFSTVAFGYAGAQPTHDGHVADVNLDGFMDMVFHFSIGETGIICGDKEAKLSGETFNGIAFTGTDTLTTTGCD